MNSLRNAILVLLVLVPVSATAQPPAGESAPPQVAVPAPRDTTSFLPPWLRGWAEFGGGWMSGPARIKRHYESGQAFAAGLEARHGTRWALRAALDYQMLIANDRLGLVVVRFDPLNPFVSYLDTVYVRIQNTGWIASVRTEAGARLPADFWLTAGAGGGYMRSGLGGFQGEGLSAAEVPTSGAVANRWGWLWTAALRYDFTPAPRVPLGVDVRTSELRSGSDPVRTWSVRLCFRMPEPRPPGAPPPRRLRR